MNKTVFCLLVIMVLAELLCFWIGFRAGVASTKSKDENKK